MDSEDRQQESPPAGRLARAALGAIDAGIDALRKLRARFEAGEGESSGDRHQGSRSGEEDALKAAPRRKTLLHRMLIVVMCLLFGGVGGMTFSYRLFSKMLDSRGRAAEFLQETIEQARKEEVRLRKTQAKCLAENGEYWKQMHEAQREKEECEGRAEELDKQVTALKAVAGPMPQVRSGGSAKPRRPMKTGECAPGTSDLTANLAACIEKFNRP